MRFRSRKLLPFGVPSGYWMVAKECGLLGSYAELKRHAWGPSTFEYNNLPGSWVERENVPIQLGTIWFCEVPTCWLSRPATPTIKPSFQDAPAPREVESWRQGAYYHGSICCARESMRTAVSRRPTHLGKYSCYIQHITPPSRISALINFNLGRSLAYGTIYFPLSE
jgi:hypothetical protein